MKRNNINNQRRRRAARNRAGIRGTAVKPRLSIFRSNRYTYAQLIDDAQGQTITAFSSKKLESKAAKEKPMKLAKLLGEKIAILAKDKKIHSAVFDRGRYRYHGRVKAVADGAREKGLKI